MACMALHYLSFITTLTALSFAYFAPHSGLWICALAVPYALLPGIWKAHTLTSFRCLLKCLLPSEAFPNHYIKNTQPASILYLPPLCISPLFNITCTPLIFSLLIHTANELSSYHVPGIVLVADNTAENKIDKNPIFWIFWTLHWEWQTKRGKSVKYVRHKAKGKKNKRKGQIFVSSLQNGSSLRIRICVFSYYISWQ